VPPPTPPPIDVTTELIDEFAPELLIGPPAPTVIVYATPGVRVVEAVK
jgi:hypothetical protein